MKISIIDASNYFRGLLLLIRKDRQITQPEIDLMKRIGKSLGFEKEFCDNAVDEILENIYIEDIPPRFSTKDLATKFIGDGLYLSFIDHDEIHPDEEQWLRSVAEKNELGQEFFSSELAHARQGKDRPYSLKVLDLTVEYH